MDSESNDLSAAEEQSLLSIALKAARAAGQVLREHHRTRSLPVDAKADGSPVTEADTRSEEVIREILQGEAKGLGIYGEEFGQEGDASNGWVIDPLDGTRNYIDGVLYYAVLIGLKIAGRPEIGIVHAPALGVVEGSDAELLGKSWIGARATGSWCGSGTSLEGAMQRSLQVRRCDHLSRAFVCHGGLNHFKDANRWDRFSSVVDQVRRTRGFGDWWGHCLVAEGVADGMLDPRIELHDMVAVDPILRGAGAVLLARNPIDEKYVGPAVSGTPKIAADLANLIEPDPMCAAFDEISVNDTRM